MSPWQWIQLLAFEGFWLLAVAGQNRWAWLVVLLLLAHFLFTPSRRADARAMLLVLPGLAVDAALTGAGVFRFAEPPWWLLLLWLGFVLTLGHSLVWLRRFSWPLLALTGALAGSSSYLAGWRLEAVKLPLGPWTSALVLALVWAPLLPLLVHLDRRLRSD